MLVRPLATLLLASSVSVTAFTAAWAVDAQQAAERLRELSARQGGTLTWSAVEEAGGKITLKGVTSTAPDVKDPIALGDLTLEDVEEGDNGDYTVGTLTMPGFSTVTEGITFSMEGIEVSGAVLPAPTSTDVVNQSGFFDSLDVASVKVEKEGKQLFTMSDFSYGMEKSDDGRTVAFAGSADAFTADMSASGGDPQTTAMLAALGLSQPKGSFEMSGEWASAEGRVALEQMDVTVDNAGTIGLTFDISGITEDFVKASQELQKTLSTGTEEQKSAANMAMMGLMQQLSIAGASLRYDDDSLAGRALDIAAGVQKMQRSDMAKMAQMMIPASLAAYTKPEFAKAVATEVAKFIENPQSLEIVAAPPAPVPFMQIGMSAMSAPQNVPDQLGIKVTANQEAEEE